MSVATWPPTAPSAHSDARRLPGAGRLRHAAAVVRRHDRGRGAQHHGRLPARRGDPAQALHYYLEASKLAYADRGRYLGDADKVDVPVGELLSRGFARERACLIDPDRRRRRPVAAGSPDGGYRPCARAGPATAAAGARGPQTTHLVVADRWGNVASYTLTIEQFGGSGITVPGRGFLLNNELTDFDFSRPRPAGARPEPARPGQAPAQQHVARRSC